jgi:inner membrane protein
MEMSKPDLAARLNASISLKLAIVFALMLLFFVPWAVVYAIVSERTSRRAEAVQEVGKIWGGSQQIGAVVLTVPYRERTFVSAASPSNPSASTEVWTEGRARFLPETLDVQAQMTPATRYRGVFPVTVYTARVKLTGRFAVPKTSTLHLEQATMFWDRATVVVGMSHTKGVSPDASFTWNGKPLALAPSIDNVSGLFGRGLEASVPDLGAVAPSGSGGSSSSRASGEVDSGGELPFEITLEIKGTRALAFLPTGKVTTVSLSSPWPDPSFTGGALPDERRGGPEGFEAQWRVGSFDRGYPQAWRESQGLRAKDESAAPAQLDVAAMSSAFGVDLMTTVDLYQQTERSVKYGMLFVGLTFLVFLLIEVLRGIRVHPMQYLLVGGALMIFYLLLLSLAEHIGFGAAYAAASAATVGLIAMYATNAFRARRDGLRAGGLLAGLYATLFVLLRLEDYALLAGAVLLFGVLASVMYLTRRVDWYDIRWHPATDAPPAIATPADGGTRLPPA